MYSTCEFSDGLLIFPVVEVLDFLTLMLSCLWSSPIALINHQCKVMCPHMYCDFFFTLTGTLMIFQCSVFLFTK